LAVLAVSEVDGAGAVDAGVASSGFLFNLTAEKSSSMSLESVSTCNKRSHIEGGGTIKVVEIILIRVRVVLNYLGWLRRFCNSRGRGYLSWRLFSRFCAHAGACAAEKDVMMLGNTMMLLEGSTPRKVAASPMPKVRDSRCRMPRWSKDD
jgi:hypothetical protein